MSIEVSLDELEAEVSERGPGYLLTSKAGGGRPHVMHLHFTADGVELQASVGRSAAANIAVEPAVTLLWTPNNDYSYSLIVDGDAKIDDGPDGATAIVTATHAVFHRPA
jgi:hypothetical protein